MKTLLQHLGLRSDCCNAEILTWHADKFYCKACLSQLTRDSKDSKDSKKVAKKTTEQHPQQRLVV